MTATARRRQAGVTLVELLFVIVIMSVVSTMVLTTWFALNKSYAYSIRSNEQRDYAREGIARLANEIRDVQAPLVYTGSAPPPIKTATAYSVTYYTTFNQAANSNPTTGPVQVRYYIGNLTGSTTRQAIYRQVDTKAPIGTFTTADPTQLVAQDVMNKTFSKPLFTFTYIDDNGNIQVSSSVPSNMTNRIQTVLIDLAIDVNPGHSPNYMEIETTVQPRNLRQT